MSSEEKSPEEFTLMPNEHALVQKAQEGDQQAFLVIWHHYLPALDRYLRSTSVHRERKDILQDVFLTAYEGLQNFRQESGINGWLFGIARKKVIDERRRQVRRQGILDSNTESVVAKAMRDPERSPELLFLKAELDRNALRALESLDTGLQFIFKLHMDPDYTYQEIADLQGVPLTTIESRIRTARREMQRFLQNPAP